MDTYSNKIILKAEYERIMACYFTIFEAIYPADMPTLSHEEVRKYVDDHQAIESNTLITKNDETP